MKNAKIIIRLFLALLIAQQAFTQNNNISSNYIFNTISMNEGLPLNFVDDIIKDSKGFIWVATQGGGLSRYDGYEFVSFNVSSEPISLKSNFIRNITEDDFGRLWVVSNNGVDIIDLTKMANCQVVCKNKTFEILLNKSADVIYNDKKGSIWILTNNDIHKLNFDKNGNITDIFSNGTNLPSNLFSTISEIGEETWVGNNGGIYKIEESQTDTLLFHPVPGIPHFGENVFISGILQMKDIIWIGTENGL